MAEPFSDEDLALIRQRLPVELTTFFERIVARFNADRKRIAELEAKLKSYEENPLYRVDPDGSIHQIYCENCAELETENERLRTAVKLYFDEKITDDELMHIIDPRTKNWRICEKENTDGDTDCKTIS